MKTNIEKENVTLLHYFLIASFFLIIVNSGDYIKLLQGNHMINYIKAAVISSYIGIMFFALSFHWASKSNKYLKEKEREQKILNKLYIYDGNQLQNINKDTVLAIESSAREIGKHIFKQEIFHKCNNTCIRISTITTLLSYILFVIGILSI